MIKLESIALDTSDNLASSCILSTVKPKGDSAIIIKKMSNGYIYCFSNKSMQGIYKIGMTKRTVQIRLAEANKHDTFKPPTPYKIKFYKVSDNVIIHSNNFLISRKQNKYFIFEIKL